MWHIPHSGPISINAKESENKEGHDLEQDFVLSAKAPEAVG